MRRLRQYPDAPQSGQGLLFVQTSQPGQVLDEGGQTDQAEVGNLHQNQKKAAMISPERQLEEQLIEKLQDLKYEQRPDIRDRVTLEKNFREKFETLNHVHLADGEFQRLLDEIVTPDVFTAAHTLRNRNSFTRDDGTPLNYTLVNIADWCKNRREKGPEKSGQAGRHMKKDDKQTLTPRLRFPEFRNAPDRRRKH